MAEVLANLEPKKVFHFFEEISKIPHPSYEEKQISDYLVAYAKERNLEYYQDELYNVIIIKEATEGYEEAAPVILQGHMDMVCEQETDCKKDMSKEGLDLYVEGDFVSARGTTLGGDDGIAVAMALAIMDSEDIPHPRLEFICTVSEEVGMEGAAHVDVSMLKGKKLLNLDSEEEGIFLAGCAGGGLATITCPLSYEPVRSEDQVMEICVQGLQGGHSGTEIHKGRGNANLIISRILTEVGKEVSFALVSLEGGSKDNAIPREAVARIAVADAEVFEKKVCQEAEKITGEYREVETDLTICINSVEAAAEQALTSEASERLLHLMAELPNGVIAMNKDIEGLVETSLNLGILKMNPKEQEAVLCYCVRSSVETAFDALVDQLEKTAISYGASYSLKGRYPAWEFEKESPLRRQMMEIYERMFHKTPVVDVMHAGVECGMIAQKIPGLDCVSIGPEMYDIHTPKERLGISSTKRSYEFVCEILKESR